MQECGPKNILHPIPPFESIKIHANSINKLITFLTSFVASELTFIRFIRNAAIDRHGIKPAHLID
jgi:hypothetical protein